MNDTTRAIRDKVAELARQWKSDYNLSDEIASDETRDYLVTTSYNGLRGAEVIAVMVGAILPTECKTSAGRMANPPSPAGLPDWIVDHDAAGALTARRPEPPEGYDLNWTPPAERKSAGRPAPTLEDNARVVDAVRKQISVLPAGTIKVPDRRWIV